MKQAIKKASASKPSAKKLENTGKENKDVRINDLQPQKLKQFNRFLEASCDCV